ncbi:MAG TPA: Fic family protein [Thermoanaerobaculia bacterium]|nr:Fic family protein [Thermoanaerobaculia bacterium]
MIFQLADLDQKEEEVLAMVARLKKSLGHAVSDAPRRWYGLLRRTTFARAVRGSNTIEGFDVSLDDAIAAAEGEEPLDPKTEAWAALGGYQSAMTYVLQLADDHHFSYSADLLRSLHYMMLQYDLSKHPGRWRQNSIFVHDDEKNEVVYEGPPSGMIPELINELLESLNGNPEMPGVIKGAMAHLNLVMIHPFSDGNGRMARCLQTMVLGRSGILSAPFSSIEEYLGRNTRAYYDVLAGVGGGSWHPERSTQPWIRFCLTAHYRQATTLLIRTREIERLWNALEEEIAKRKLPDRTILALADGAHGLRVRNATYRSIAEINENLASRDLKALVMDGLLIPQGEKRGRFYIATDLLKSIRNRTRETRKVRDPFLEEPKAPESNLMLPGMEA